MLALNRRVHEICQNALKYMKLHCVPKNAPPSCDDNFVKSEPIFKILITAEKSVKFPTN